MHSIKYLFGILILHFIYITTTRSHVGKYNKAIQHIGGGGGGGGGGEIIHLRLKKTSHKDNNKN